MSCSEDDYEAHPVPSCILAGGTLLALNQVQKEHLKKKSRLFIQKSPFMGVP
jgi:hypothetical protein